MDKPEGITKVMYYYGRDAQKRPVVTVCLMQDAAGVWYRGIAICSPKDIPWKQRGRGIAYGRALSAFTSQGLQNLQPVMRPEACDILKHVPVLSKLPPAPVPEGVVFTLFKSMRCGAGLLPHEYDIVCRG